MLHPALLSYQEATVSPSPARSTGSSRSREHDGCWRSYTSTVVYIAIMFPGMRSTSWTR